MVTGKNMEQNILISVDINFDRHLSLMEFMSGLPSTLKSSDIEFLKQVSGWCAHIYC